MRRAPRRQLGAAAPRISSVRITSLPRRQPISFRVPGIPRQSFAVSSAVDRPADRARQRPCKSTVHIRAPVPSRPLSRQPRSRTTKILPQVLFPLPSLLPHLNSRDHDATPELRTGRRSSCPVTGGDCQDQVFKADRNQARPRAGHEGTDPPLMLRK